MLLPLDSLLFGRNPPAGMCLLTIAALARDLRKTAEPVDPPILVTRVDGTGFYRVTDGRHRVVASLIAGRAHIDADVEA